MHNVKIDFNFIKLLYFINLINATAICYSFLCLSLEQIYDLSFPVPLLHYIKFNHQIIILFATNLISLISLIFINLRWHFEKKKKKKKKNSLYYILLYYISKIRFWY